jgi:hypothetical protein
VVIEKNAKQTAGKPGFGGVDMTSLNELLQAITQQRGLDNPRFVINSAGQLIPNAKLKSSSAVNNSQKEAVQQARVETAAPQVSAVSQSSTGTGSGGQSSTIPQSTFPSYSKTIDTSDSFGTLLTALRRALLDDTERLEAIRSQGITRPDTSETWDKVSAFTSGVGNGVTAKAGNAADMARTSNALNQKYRDIYSDVAEEDIPAYIEGLLELGSRDALDYESQVQMKYGMRWLHNLGVEKGNISPADPHMADPQHRLQPVSEADRETSHAALAAYEVLASQYSKPFALLTGALSFVPGVQGGYNRAYESGELFSDLADSEQYGDIYDLVNSHNTIETAKEESPGAYWTGAALSGLAQAAIPLGEAKVMEWLGKAVSPIITKAGLKLPTYAELINNLLQKGRTIVTNAEKNQGKVFAKGEKIPTDMLKTKPLYSPSAGKWLDDGGEITIDKGIWKYTNPEGISVTYKNGYPDFKGSGLVIREIDIGSFRNRTSDFKLADEIAPGGPKSRLNTWHHHEDGRTLQEINKDIHETFTHQGGMSLMKKGK